MSFGDIGEETEGRRDSDVALPNFVVVSRLPAPYREPLFERVAARGLIDIHVIYEFGARQGTAWGLDKTGQAGFRYSKEVCCEIQKGLWEGVRAFGHVWRCLPRIKPDLVLIHGYSFWTAWAAILRCRFSSIPYALRSDSNVHITKGSNGRRQLKSLFLKWLVRKASAIFYIGTTNKAYWESFGANERQLVEARYAVDETIFSPQLREKPDNIVRFLFVGRLIGRKRVMTLLEAFARVAGDRDDVTLTIVGTGPDAESVSEFISKSGCRAIRFEGRRSPGDLPGLYREHDVLICPYRDEPWGLAINEAMSCGLAVIAATNGTCGAAVDLVEDGINGIGLGALTAESLAHAIETTASNPEFLSQWKINSLKIIQQWRYDSAVEAFSSATISVASGRKE